MSKTPPMQYRVFFEDRELPQDFPGETGTFGFLRICPPTDLGEFRFVPQMQLAHWQHVVPEALPAPPPYVPFSVPTADQIPAHLDGITLIGSAMVWRRQGNEETVLQVLRDHEGNVVMAVYFVGSRLRFRLRTLEIEMDCAWAAGVQGLAFLCWEPGRIFMRYYLPQPGGTHDMRSATSDDYVVDATALIPGPGDNFDALRQVAQGEQMLPTLSFGVAVCLLSERSLSQDDIRAVVHQYGEAIRDLVHVDSPEFSQVVGFPIHVRNQVVDGELFERWRQAMGYPMGWGGEAWSVLIPAEIPREVLEEIQDLQAYASLTKMMRDSGTEDELDPPPRMVGRDPLGVLWHHVARKHILDAPENWRLRDAVQARVWNVGRRLVLQCQHLQPVYDLIGTDWLEKVSAKVRQRLDATRINPNLMVEQHPAVLGWRWLRQDVILDDAAHQDVKVRAWGWLTQLASNLHRVDAGMPPGVRAEMTKRLRSDGYDQAAFEVKVAALLMESGARPSFVPPADKRSPDLRVEQDALHYFVECCRKEPNSRDVDRALNLAKELAGLTLSREVRKRRSTLVTISFKKLLTPEIFSEARKLLDQLGPSGQSETEDIALTATPLGAWGDVCDTNDLVRRVREQYTLVYVGGDRMAFWPMNRVMHASVVAIEMPLERDLFGSLESTLDNKGRWQSRDGQIPDDSLGALALGLGDSTWATVLKLAPMLKDRLERRHEAVSAIMLMWDERDHENMLTCIVKSHCLPIVNSRARKPWPESLALPAGVVGAMGLTSQLGPVIRRRE